ncbi:bifunctional 2-polyprenyl-6-hydroxyphenol methylase/3-demethylubiquinol 3-O-methyltransferase UbiG [Poseidonocella sp. HB161398]|uniref:class I SAM-dependent methyltransferase n=1 Tax=Poseidonocella sp. HB161398 TaxID=2320855 RepID=UPI001109EEB4|nr:class I SAM-dependent methyltransferase [Poseidonocella sp. HB161398]
MREPQKFWNRLAPRYARMPVRDQDAYREKLRRTRMHLGPQASVLEAGCGTGSTALALADAAGHVLATDFSGKMIAIAEKKRREAGAANVEFRTAWWDELSGSYDAVLAMNVFHVLPHAEPAVGHLASLVKPGGVLVSSTTCVADNSVFARRLAPVFAAVGVFPQISIFSRAQYEAMLARAGLEIIDSWHPRRLAAWFDVARKPLPPGQPADQPAPDQPA